MKRMMIIRRVKHQGRVSVWIAVVVLMGPLCGLSPGGLMDIPQPAPSWWGTTDGQTASLFADLTDEAGLLEWDEYVVGDNLQLENFTISVTDMVWVPGEGYQSNSPGSFQIVLGNDRRLNRKKNIAYRFKVTPGDKPLEDIEDVVVEAVWTGDGTTDDWSIGGGAIESIKFSYTYEEQQDGSFVLETDGWVQPQPWKVRFTVQTKGSGTGPKIQKVWSGEKCVPIPEPCTLLLMGMGLGFCHRVRRPGRRNAR